MNRWSREPWPSHAMPYLYGDRRETGAYLYTTRTLQDYERERREGMRDSEEETVNIQEDQP